MMGDFAFQGDSSDQVISKGERKGRIVGVRICGSIGGTICHHTATKKGAILEMACSCLVYDLLLHILGVKLWWKYTILYIVSVY